MEFAFTANEDYWPPYSGPLLHPNLELWQATEGCPVLTKIQNEMDVVEPGQPKRCGMCRQEGMPNLTCFIL